MNRAESRPRIVSLVTLGGFEEGTVLAFAASLERCGGDRLATAILQGACEQRIELKHVDDFEVLTGKGLIGRIGSHSLALGNTALFAHLGVALGDLGKWAEQFGSEGQTVIFLSVDGRPAGLFGVVGPQTL
jgi:Cu+-exporting ATPase